MITQKHTTSHFTSNTLPNGLSIALLSKRQEAISAAIVRLFINFVHIFSVIGKSEGEGEKWHGHVTAVTVAPDYRRLHFGAMLMHYTEYISELSAILQHVYCSVAHHLSTGITAILSTCLCVPRTRPASGCTRHLGTLYTVWFFCIIPARRMPTVSRARIPPKFTSPCFHRDAHRSQSGPRQGVHASVRACRPATRGGCIALCAGNRINLIVQQACIKGVCLGITVPQ